MICDKCGKIFRDKTRLKQHHRNDHSNEPKPQKIPEQCPFCQKWYSSKSSAYEHIRNMHTENDVEHRCPTCGFVSTTAKALKKHIIFNHEQERRHKCNLCEKAFKRPQDLKVSLHVFYVKDMDIKFFDFTGTYGYTYRRTFV